MNKEKTKKVSFFQKRIRDISRRNRRTGTQDNMDSDSDSDSDLGADSYTEPFSPPPSPSQVSDIPIVPSAGVYASARRVRPPIFYRPFISVFDKINRKVEYSEEYTFAFNQFLAGKEIVCNDDTEIEFLIEELTEMFKEDYSKIIKDIKFGRDKIVFDINSKLGRYSNLIKDYSEQNGMNNYFSIAVSFNDNQSAGGSRRKKTNKRKKTIKRKKAIKRKKTNKRRK